MTAAPAVLESGPLMSPASSTDSNASGRPMPAHDPAPALDEVLVRLAETAAAATGARRCTVSLFDDGLVWPRATVAGEPLQDMSSTVRSLGPVEPHSKGWRRLSTGQPVVLDRARAERLVPGLGLGQQSALVALVALPGDGRPSGLLTVEWDSRREVTPDDVAVVGAIARYAGTAIRNGQAFQAAQRRAQLQQALTRGATALASAPGPSAIADRLAGAYTDLIGAPICVVALLDEEWSWVTDVASRGVATPEAPVPVPEIPREVARRLRREPNGTLPIELEREPWLDTLVGARVVGVTRYLLLPLLVGGRGRGCALLGFSGHRRLDGEERLAARALADIAATALERSVLLGEQERRLRQMDALYRVSAVLSEGADADTMIAELNELLAGQGIEVVGLAVCDPALARRLKAEELTPRESEAWVGRTAWEALSNGCAAIPMRLGDDLVGVLRVRPSVLDAEERSFLETMARGLAEVVNRDAARAALEEGSRERAVADERDRLASDLHDTAGQVFVGIGLLARQMVEGFPPGSPKAARIRRIAELADAGKSEIDEAARALAFAPLAAKGLVPSLRALAADVERDSGLAVNLRVHGDAAHVESMVELALFRVAHQAVTNAWRHAGCRAITIDLAYGDHEVTLSVADDGTGLGDPPAPAGRGLGGMRRAMAQVGGNVEVAGGTPSGLVVTARVAGEGR